MASQRLTTLIATNLIFVHFNATLTYIKQYKMSFGKFPQFNCQTCAGASLYLDNKE